LKSINQMNFVEQALQKNDWLQEDRQGLRLLFSPLLKDIPQFTHTFTTRIGGTTPAPLDSFNLGRHRASEESKADALANRRRLCEVLSFTPERLTVPGQVHSNNVSWVTGPETLPDVDAVATANNDTPLLLSYADCVPIIIVDPKARAVAVIHAGWRGTAAGIAKNAVEVLQAKAGSDPANLRAAIGPAICSNCYPTGDDVATQLSATVSQTEGLIKYQNGQPHPELAAFNALQLRESGVEQVDVCSLCTACHPELFYSHRRFNGDTGRQGAIAGFQAPH